MAAKVLIAGGTGLIGRRLTAMLVAQSYEVKILSRRIDDQSDNQLYWNPDKGEIQEEAREAEYVINLAGAGIADKRWSVDRKQRLMDSRVLSTSLLVNFFNNRGERLKRFISASAVGYYGNTAHQICDETNSPVSPDFLSHVCKSWELEAASAAQCADRTTVVRISTVLSNEGGALPKMIQPMRYGLAGYFGSGEQYMSWIHIDDLCRLISYLITNDTNIPVINAVAGHPVKNRELIGEIRRQYYPHTILMPIPVLLLRAGMGEMSTLLLNSSRVVSTIVPNLEDFKLLYQQLPSALQNLLADQN